MPPPKISWRRGDGRPLSTNGHFHQEPTGQLAITGDEFMYHYSWGSICLRRLITSKFLLLVLVSWAWIQQWQSLWVSWVFIEALTAMSPERMQSNEKKSRGRREGQMVAWCVLWIWILLGLGKFCVYFSSDYKVTKFKNWITALLLWNWSFCLVHFLFSSSYMWWSALDFWRFCHFVVTDRHTVLGTCS